MKDEVRADIQTLVAAIESQLVDDRRDFHRLAESGWTEFRSAAHIADRLTQWGFDVQCGRTVCASDARMGLPSDEVLEAHVHRAQQEGANPTFLEPLRGGFTGVVGTLRRGEGPTVGLRFDIDALDLDESAEGSHRPTAEGFASVHPGVCHACGHDGHAAIGLGVARVVTGLKDRLSGTVKLIFQPAEEGVRGARSMVAAGIVDDVDVLLGHHLVTGARVGEIFPGMGGYAATRKFDVHFRGAPAHAGGLPEGGHNALLAAATAALHLYGIPRHRDGFTRVNVGRLLAGSGRNVIAADATLVAEVRGETTALCDSMYDHALAVVDAAARMYGCQVEVRAMGQAGTANSDEMLAARIQAVLADLPGISFHTMQKMGGSEDFTEMMSRVQSRGGQAANIGIGADYHGTGYLDEERAGVLPAHTAVYDFDERALGFAVQLLTELIVEFLPAGS